MSTDIVRAKVQEIVDTIDRPDFQRQLMEALPAGLSVEKFTRTTKLSIQMNPEILTADRASLFLAMVKCARDGLLPDGREAALVKVKVKGKDTVAYWPMIGGFRKKAAEHGFSIEAHAVYSRDEFNYTLGENPSVTHYPPPLGEDRGDLIGAYAVATAPDGKKYVEVMGKPEIEQVRATSRAATSEYGPWVNWPAEMYRKTPARRLFKQLPFAELDEPTVRVFTSSDAEVTEATATEPALANLPVVEGEIMDGEPDEV